MDTPLPPGVEQISEAEAMRLLTSDNPGLVSCYIGHDDWCQALATGKAHLCNCNPTREYFRLRLPPGRQAPVTFTQPRAGDPSLAVDTAFFKRNPGRREYTRKYIPGETVESMHPDTLVRVLLVGAERVRGFVPPAVDRRN